MILSMVVHCQKNCEIILCQWEYTVKTERNCTFMINYKIMINYEIMIIYRIKRNQKN